MAIDGFSRRAGIFAYLVAACSFAYAVVYLGFGPAFWIWSGRLLRA